MKVEGVRALRSKRGLHRASGAGPQVLGLAPQTTKERNADTMKTYLLKNTATVEPKAGRGRATGVHPGRAGGGQAPSGRQPHRRRVFPLPKGPKAMDMEAEKKRPGDFTGLVQPSVALRLRALTPSSCASPSPRSSQSYPRG
jgi:hypothetical protein